MPWLQEWRITEIKQRAVAIHLPTVVEITSVHKLYFDHCTFMQCSGSTTKGQYLFFPVSILNSSQLCIVTSSLKAFSGYTISVFQTTEVVSNYSRHIQTYRGYFTHTSAPQNRKFMGCLSRKHYRDAYLGLSFPPPVLIDSGLKGIPSAKADRKPLHTKSILLDSHELKMASVC